MAANGLSQPSVPSVGESNLTAQDLTMFRSLGIPEELLVKAGVHRVTDCEAREVYGIQFSGGLGGIVFRYFDPRTGHRVTARLRRDRPETDSSGKPLNKYISPFGDRRHLYFPPDFTDLLSDASVPVVIVEAEKSALAMAALSHRLGRRLLPVACGGCWGWRGRIGITEGPSGQREEEKGPLPDLDLVAMENREITLMFDANAATNPQVQQAGAALARELARRGARVRIAELPTTEGVNGPDDAIARWGDGRVLAILDAAAPFSEASPEESANRKSQAQLLIELAEDAELFHTEERVAYSTIPNNGHREHWPVNSKEIRHWLVARFYRRFGKPPSTQSLKEALETLEAKAIYEGAQRTIAVRVGGQEGKIYLDLADSEWRAVEIDSSGWRVVQDPPIAFVRPPGMLAFPVPKYGGRVDELRRFINVGEQDSWVLLLSALVAALNPTGPYPITALHGEQGSAKSTTAQVFRKLVDPNAANLRPEPRSEQDLVIAAQNNQILVFDNLSRIQPWLSDALCRLTSGTGFATRKLYTDDQETILHAQRPIVLTSIEEVITRSDLLDRSLIIELTPIPEDRRRPEQEFWREFDAAWPRILGALLTAVSGGLQRLPSMKLKAYPRMADFAKWAVACEESLGLPAGSFMRAYQENIIAATEPVLEASPIIEPLFDVAPFEGTAQDLLEELHQRAGDYSDRQPGWPKGPRGLSGVLRRLAPNLRRKGLSVTFRRSSGGKRLIRVVKALVRGVAADGSDGSDGDFTLSESRKGEIDKQAGMVTKKERTIDPTDPTVTTRASKGSEDAGKFGKHTDLMANIDKMVRTPRGKGILRQVLPPVVRVSLDPSSSRMTDFPVDEVTPLSE